MNKEDQANKEIQAVLKKYGLKLKTHLSFPIYKILPDEAQLALKVLSRHGMKITVTLIALK